MSRAFDFCLGLVLALSFSPLMILLALYVLVAAGWPVFYCDPRLGRGQKRFKLVKFRSLAPGTGPAVTTSRDPRLQDWGRWLRRSHLDELPQLWQVVCGQLALLGPRPESPHLVRLDDPAEIELLNYRPGFIDPDLQLTVNEAAELAQHADPEAWYREQIRPGKVERALRWLRSRSRKQDLRGILAALAGVFSTKRVS